MVTDVVVGTFTPSVLLDLAGSTGRLAQAGIAATPVPVSSSPAQFRSLVEGGHDVAMTSPDNVLAYRFSPSNPLGAVADVRIVSAVDRGMGLGLYARPGLGAEDLRGAVVGVDVPTSGFALALYALLESYGLTRDDYELTGLGATPRRLEALLDGSCDVTMLNAGNELVAEQRGCARLAGVLDACAPYLGTVLAVAGDRRLPEALALAAALSDTAAAVVSGELAAQAREAASRLLPLDDELAERYLARMQDPDEGLVPDGRADHSSLATLVGLRQRYLPELVDGVDVLDGALATNSGLVLPFP